MSAPVQSDWIDWSGGECPVSPETRVHIRCRDRWDTEKMSGTITRDGYDAGSLDWTHKTNFVGMGDIIAYRVVSL